MIQSVGKWVSTDRTEAYSPAVAPFGIVPYCQRTLLCYISRWGKAWTDAATDCLWYTGADMSDHMSEREIERLYATGGLGSTVEPAILRRGHPISVAGRWADTVALHGRNVGQVSAMGAGEQLSNWEFVAGRQCRGHT